MSANASRFAGRRLLSKHRVVLLATIAGFTAIAIGQFGIAPKSGTTLLTPAYAQTLQRPAGFADIVEKVKPAVVSVKVRVNAGGNNLSLNEDNPQRGSPFEDFFRRFGSPEGGQRFGSPDGGRRFGRPDGEQRFGRRDDGQGFGRAPQRRQYAMGQGSGFFISADGYAVTNNHVVDKAERVEVTTDDGKTSRPRLSAPIPAPTSR